MLACTWPHSKLLQLLTSMEREAILKQTKTHGQRLWHNSSQRGLIHISGWGAVKTPQLSHLFFHLPNAPPLAAEAAARGVHMLQSQCFASWLWKDLFPPVLGQGHPAHRAKMPNCALPLTPLTLGLGSGCLHPYDKPLCPGQLHLLPTPCPGPWFPLLLLVDIVPIEHNPFKWMVPLCKWFATMTAYRNCWKKTF